MKSFDLALKAELCSRCVGAQPLPQQRARHLERDLSTKQPFRDPAEPPAWPWTNGKIPPEPVS